MATWIRCTLTLIASNLGDALASLRGGRSARGRVAKASKLSVGSDVLAAGRARIVRVHAGEERLAGIDDDDAPSLQVVANEGGPLRLKAGNVERAQEVELPEHAPGILPELRGNIERQEAQPALCLIGEEAHAVVVWFDAPHVRPNGVYGKGELEGTEAVGIAAVRTDLLARGAASEHHHRVRIKPDLLGGREIDVGIGRAVVHGARRPREGDGGHVPRRKAR